MSRAPILAWLALLALAGCTGLPPSHPPSERVGDYWVPANAARPVGPVESLLHYGQYLRSLSGADLGREQEQVRLALANEKSDFRRIQYALALSAPSAAARDEQRAQQLLEPLTKDSDVRAKPLNAFAALLLAELLERRRALELEQKLEALKSIERGMMSRERKPPR